MKTKAELIEGKVMASLINTEEAEFNRFLNSDRAFAKDYQIVLHLSDYLKNDKLFQFRDSIQQVGSEYRNGNSGTQLIYFKTYWKHIASVAAVLLLFFGGYWYMNMSQSTHQLFDQYYEIDEVYMNTRSGNSNSTDILEQGLLLFENDQYKESINYFEQVPSSITAVYYSGVAHMEIGEYEVAKYKFNQVIDNYVNVFYDQAMWYKGLCLLKQDHEKDALVVFNTISKSNSYYKDKAKELANKLK